MVAASCVVGEGACLKAQNGGGTTSILGTGGGAWTLQVRVWGHMKLDSHGLRGPQSLCLAARPDPAAPLSKTVPGFPL